MVFDRCALHDPLSQPRSYPSYSEELLAWHAKLRSFLCTDGKLPFVGPLLLMSGDTLNQEAIHLTRLGEEQRLLLYNAYMQRGSVPEHRPRPEPIAISMDAQLDVSDLLDDSEDDPLCDDALLDREIH